MEVRQGESRRSHWKTLVSVNTVRGETYFVCLVDENLSRVIARPVSNISRFVYLG